MKEEIVTTIIQRMLPFLENDQLMRLRRELECILCRYDICPSETSVENKDNDTLVSMFIAAKRVEGCSEKTLKYYQTTIDNMVISIGRSICSIRTEDLRIYLTDYQHRNLSSRVTVDNIRRILSSFFSWLEDEDYIMKSPVRRIHKIKTSTSVKTTYTDEELELMRDSCCHD